MENEIEISVMLVEQDDDLPLPEYAHSGDVGLDLRSRENKIIKSGEWELIKTGIKIAIPEGYGGFIYPRSGLALKEGITVLNADGAIDSSYRGELGVILINHGDKKFEVNRGDRIAQLVVHEVNSVIWNVVDDLDDSDRGENGFGDSGIK